MPNHSSKASPGPCFIRQIFLRIAKMAAPRVNEPVTTEIPSPALLSRNQQEIILHALNVAGANHPCQRCGTNSFELQPGLSMISLQGANRNVMIGGTQIPAALVVCSGCGAINMHALGALGLINHPAFGLGSQ